MTATSNLRERSIPLVSVSGEMVRREFVMVLFISTKVGWDEMEPLVRLQNAAVWVNHGVLTPPELASLHADGINLTTFSHPTDAEDDNALATALAIIREHHPGERVWVERSAG